MAAITKVKNRYRVQVRRQGIALSKTFSIRKDAETWGKQTELDIERAELRQDPKKKLQGVTLGQIVERYRDTVSPRKKSGHNEQIILNAFLRHGINKKAIADIRSSDFAEYRDFRLKTVQATTLKRELTVLKNVFKIAEKEWNLPLKVNPVSQLEFSAPIVRRDRTLRDGELELIIENARQRKNPFILPIILFALETGMRMSEIIGARWQHLDLKHRLLLIPDTKNGTPRTIPLTKTSIEVLEGLDPIGERIFPVSAGLLKVTWQRILQRTGIADPPHFHDLRHHCITDLFNKGLSIGDVSAISGHRSWACLKTYVNPRPADILRKLGSL